MAEHPVMRQRAALCDLLKLLSDEQWEAETLCEGWDAGDVAAHLLARERDTVSSLGILVAPLEGLHERSMARRKAEGRDALIAGLRSGPSPWMRAPIARDVQVGEDWIHTADIARGGAATAPGPEIPVLDGTEDPAVARLLWKAVTRFAPMTLRGVDLHGVVDLTDGTQHRTFAVGGKMAKAAKDAQPDVTITGSVGELVLFATGRSAARVERSGDDDLVAALDAADKGF